MPMLRQLRPRLPHLRAVHLRLHLREARILRPRHPAVRLPLPVARHLHPAVRQELLLRHPADRTEIHLLLLPAARTAQLLHPAVTEHPHLLRAETILITQVHLLRLQAVREQAHRHLHPAARAIQELLRLHQADRILTVRQHLHSHLRTDSEMFRTEPTETVTAEATITTVLVQTGTSVTQQAGNTFGGSDLCLK